MTSVKFFTHLFGDSSYIVYYLRCLGYDLSRVEQTGSNFGTEVGHENPYLSTIGSGTMVADGLTIMNADVSSTSFRVSRVSIGPHNFVGQQHRLSRGGRTGANCLLATKAMIPLDGQDPRRGRPARLTVLRDPAVGRARQPVRPSPDEDERRARGLTREEPGTTCGPSASSCPPGGCTSSWSPCSSWPPSTPTARYRGGCVMAAFLALGVLVTPVYFVLVERGLRAFRALQPQFCSIYDPYFWRHERLWKVPEEAYLHMFDGTPFKNLIWRVLGVRIGQPGLRRRLLPVTERTPDRHRRRLRAQRGQQDPVPLAGGRHVQVRPDHGRRRLHARGRRHGPLRRDDGRGRRCSPPTPSS